jgi:formylglycine-generating enzyme required for sulfatase activity
VVTAGFVAWSVLGPAPTGTAAATPSAILNPVRMAAARHTRPLPPGDQSFANAIGLRLVRIPAGAFIMGTPLTELGRFTNEGPPHPVRITRPFLMGIYEVTQAEYEAVMGHNPAELKGPRRPVERVVRAEALAFCDKLSALPAEKAAGRRYRLPTEAEWEYACRAGTRTAFAFPGDTLTADQANVNEAYDGTTEVGSFPPNAFGLYDMHGNVWEFCQDWFKAGYYDESPPEDPPGPAVGTLVVLRGGAWEVDLLHARSGRRGQNDPNLRNRNFGFRVVADEVARPQ